MFGRLFLIVCGLAGGLFASQASSVALQYQQRLGDAIDALGDVVAQFDADAARNGLDRGQALLKHDAADDASLKGRGLSIERAVVRYEALVSQRKVLTDASPVMRSLLVARDVDSDLMAGVLKDYAFAPSLDLVGLFYSIVGVFSGLSIAGFLRGLARWIFGSRGVIVG